MKEWGRGILGRYKTRKGCAVARGVVKSFETVKVCWKWKIRL